MKKQWIKSIDKFFYIEFYIYHNLQIWAKFVGQLPTSIALWRHDAALDPFLPGF